ncbi:hypothetical protein ACSSTF_004837, partial [Escherichia coli]
IHAPDQVIEKVLRMNPDVFIYKNYGFNHYTETYCFSEIFVFANPENLDMGWIDVNKVDTKRADT